MIGTLIVACTVCFGNADGPLLDAARLGVLTLVGVTLCVLGAFARWFLVVAALQGTEGAEATEGMFNTEERRNEEDSADEEQ